MLSNHVLAGRALFLCSALISLSPAAHAQQILTAIESEYNGSGPADTQISNSAGQLLSTTFGGVDTHAVTNFGVNKIYVSGNANYEQYASSAWLDSYTVGGTPGSTVSVSFTFSVDGLANFTGDDASLNFNIYALRGGNWSMSGYNQDAGGQFAAFDGGSTYERLVLRQTVADRVSLADMRDFGGFYNYANAGGEPGAFGSHVLFNEAGNYYSAEDVVPAGIRETRLFATGFSVYINGAQQTPGIVPYAAAPQLGVVRANLEANYSLLDMAQLCAGESCAGGIYPGSDLTLSFDIAAGSVFTLASFLYADDLRDGTIDFFNTAKVTGVTLSPGATIESQSGTLKMLADGSYGYSAITASVPEPSTWAMMIGGFFLVGTAARRRNAKAIVQA